MHAEATRPEWLSPGSEVLSKHRTKVLPGRLHGPFLLAGPPPARRRARHAGHASDTTPEGVLYSFMGI